MKTAKFLKAVGTVNVTLLIIGILIRVYLECVPPMEPMQWPMDNVTLLRNLLHIALSTMSMLFGCFGIINGLLSLFTHDIKE